MHDVPQRLPVVDAGDAAVSAAMSAADASASAPVLVPADEAAAHDGAVASGESTASSDQATVDSMYVGAPGYAAHKADHLKRLRRIEGQTRGLQRMVENDEYCIDVLTQVSATVSALKSLALSLLDEHLAHCVTHAIHSGGTEAERKLAEANAAIARLVRS